MSTTVSRLLALHSIMDQANSAYSAVRDGGRLKARITLEELDSAGPKAYNGGKGGGGKGAGHARKSVIRPLHPT